jgi:SAM-dependent methyltransferase
MRGPLGRRNRSTLNDTDLSPRLAEIVDALPLRPGLRVLEIGCGPGAAARAVAKRIGEGQVLGIDRSAKAIKRAIVGSQDEIASGRLRFRHVAVEDFELEKGEKPYDIAFAVRVGALDGRHPEAGRVARQRIRRGLVRGGRLYIDGAIRSVSSLLTSSS